MWWRRLEALQLDHPLREQFARQSMLALLPLGSPGRGAAGGAAVPLRAARRARASAVGGAARPRAAILEDRDDLAWVPPRGGRRHLPRRPGSVSARFAAGGDHRSSSGRERDLELAGRLLESGRVLTLFGPGGVGKTRLAHRLASTIAPQFADGVRLVELGPVRDEGAVTAAIAAALDVQQRPNRSLDDSIVELLAPRSMLLVLDNCEHVLDTTSELVELVLRWCPAGAGARHEPGAARHPRRGGVVGATAAGAARAPTCRSTTSSTCRRCSCSSTALARAQADFALDDEQPSRGRRDLHPARRRAAGAGACRGAHAVDEPGAARRAPAGAVPGAGRLATRHRPPAPHLRDLVQWSYDLLTPVEQQLFDRLSVFAGSFVLERAEQVCAGDGIDERDVAGLLGVLVDKSMLVAQGRAVPPARDSARVRARRAGRVTGSRGGARRAHCGPCRPRRARGERPRWSATRRSGWPRWSRASTTCARRTARRSQPATSTRLCGSSSASASTRGGASATSTSPGQRPRVGMPGAREHRLLPVALGVVACGHFVRGELEQAVAVGEEAVAEAQRLDSLTAGLAERALGNALFYLHREREALAWMDRMLDAARATGAPGIVAHAAYMRSVAETSIGDPAGGAEIAALSAAAAIESGSPTALAQADYAPRHRRSRRPNRRGAGALRPERRTRRGGRQPVDPCLRADREPLDPRPSGQQPRRARWIPRRGRHLVPRERLGEPVADVALMCSRSSSRSVTTRPRQRSTARSRQRV